MENTKRESGRVIGYYHVCINGRWDIAKWMPNSMCWWYQDDTWKDSEFDEIDERPITRKSEGETSDVELLEEAIFALQDSNQSMEYAAFNYDGSKIENLRPTLHESTGVSDSLLISVRDNNILIDKIKRAKRG